MAEWTSGGEVHCLMAVLEAGKAYTLHEKETPEGYSVAPNREFTVRTDGKTQDLVLTDEELAEIPETGTQLAYPVFAGALAGLMACLFILRKKRDI